MGSFAGYELSKFNKKNIKMEVDTVQKKKVYAYNELLCGDMDHHKQ